MSKINRSKFQRVRKKCKTQSFKNPLNPMNQILKKIKHHKLKCYAKFITKKQVLEEPVCLKRFPPKNRHQ